VGWIREVRRKALEINRKENIFFIGGGDERKRS
jgi:hypothetical protein